MVKITDQSIRRIRGKWKEYDVNPFAGRFSFVTESVGISIAKKYEMINTATGEIGEIELKGKPRRVKKDTAMFTKIYTPGWTAMRGLNLNGVYVLSVIASIKLKPGVWEVDFYIPDMVKECGFKTVGSVYRGLNSLVDNFFIAKSSELPTRWFVNPYFLFSGKRQSAIQSSVRTKINELQHRIESGIFLPSELSLIRKLEDFESKIDEQIKTGSYSESPEE